MSKWQGAVVAVMTFLLSACSTGYQPYSYFGGGGYSETQIDANTYTVTFEGNGYTDKATVNKFLLYRCAELTAQAGGDFFVIVNSSDDSRSMTMVNPGASQSFTSGTAMINQYGYGSYSGTTTTYSAPMAAYGIVLPTGSATIKVLKGPLCQ